LKTIQKDTLPKCDIPGCNEEAHYDDKTKMGPWGFLCERHEREFGMGIGTRLEKRVNLDVKKTDQIPVVSIPLSLDDVAEVRCPHCGESRTVEPDANYVVTCENCGNKYKVVSEI